MQNAECKIISEMILLNNNAIEEKSFNFSIRIVNLYKYLTVDKK